MKEYKLINGEGNCLPKCPYELKVLGRIMSCYECKHYKGMSSLKKHVKCSYEYNTQKQEPDCGDDCICKQTPDEKGKKIKLKLTRKRMNKIQEFICSECANQDALKARPKDIETKKYCDDCDYNLDRYIVKEKQNETLNRKSY
jgi:hypothetical protein